MSDKTSGPILDLSRTREAALKADRPRSRWPVLLFALVTLSVFVSAAFLLLRPRDTLYRVQTYTLAEAIRSTLRETTAATGRVVPERVINFIAPADGVLTLLDVVAGDRVKPGTLLAKLKSPDLEQNLIETQSHLEEARDAVVLARVNAQATHEKYVAVLQNSQDKLPQLERDLSIARQLFAVGGESRVNVQKLQDALRSARQARDAAKLDLNADQRSSETLLNSLARKADHAGRQLRDAQKLAQSSMITSALEGQVLEVKGNTGNLVKAGDLLLSVADTRRMRVDASVDEATASSVIVGNLVALEVGDSRFLGEVIQVAPQAVAGQNSSSVPIRVRFQGKVPHLRPNVTATLEITTRVRKDVLSLPRAPFLTSGGERLVFVLTSSDRAVRREIVFGASSADRIEVISGLVPGERVLTSSMEAYKDRPNVEVSPTGLLQQE